MYPVSIKGILIEPGGAVVLALNDRNEWELPGGRLEIGESPEVCLVREFQEELSVAVRVDELLDTYLFEVIPGKHVFIVTYACSLDGPYTVSAQFPAPCMQAPLAVTGPRPWRS